MFDVKVLAAVFATLAAFGLAMNGGHIDSSKIKSIGASETDFNPRSYVPDSLGAFTEFLDNPEPETSVSGNLVVQNPDGQGISVQSGSMTVKNMEEITLDKRKFKSDESIVLNSFNGDLNFNDKLKISGRSKGFTSSGVNVSGELKIEKRVDSPKIELKEVRRSSINFDQVSGDISSNSTSATISGAEANLRINSFSGNLTFYPDNGSLLFEGEVDRLNAGSISFGN